MKEVSKSKIICNLKEIRKNKQIKQYDIAKCLNVRQTTVSEWENDKKVPNLRKAYELAEYLEVEVAEIWNRKN